MTSTSGTMTEPSRLPMSAAVVSALCAAAWTATPDYVSTVRERRWVRAGLCAATGVGFAFVFAREALAGQATVATTPDTPAADWPDAGENVDAEPVPLAERWLEAHVPEHLHAPLLTGAAVAAVAGALALMPLEQRLEDAGAGWLARRGIPAPYTVLGLVQGGVTFALAVSPDPFED